MRQGTYDERHELDAVVLELLDGVAEVEVVFFACHIRAALGVRFLKFPTTDLVRRGMHKKEALGASCLENSLPCFKLSFESYRVRVA